MSRYNTLPVSCVSIIRAKGGDYKSQMAMPCHAPSEWLAERPRESVQLQGITDDSDYLVPDPRICYFHKHVGEQVVREVADAAILAAGLSPKMKAEA